MKQMDFRAELAKLTPRLRDNRPGKIYVFGVGQQWRGIHQWYINVVNVDLADYVFAFIDNDSAKQGTTHMGRPVVAPSEIDLDNAVVLISSDMYTMEIIAQLNKLGLINASSYFIAYYFEVLLKRFMYAETASFTGSVHGGRCFVIGNGPSLRVEDLDILYENNEACFGVNRITNIFDKTLWRPAYYLLVDPVAHPGNNAVNAMKNPKFLRMNLASHDIFDEYIYYFDEDKSGLWYDYPYKMKFSANIEQMFFGGNVIHFAIQAAVSIGYNEIYLYGVDNTFPTQVTNDGTVVTKDVKLHFFDGGIEFFAALPIDITNQGFACAREYCDSHGVKIRNATRGGALEVFQRVDFDTLF